jgi:hypothetical protein
VTTAHALAYERASRPKPAKLATNLALRAIVQDDLVRRYSPEQIAGRLRRRFPGQPEMWVSTETIYQSLYVQSRGALRRELTRYLPTGRALRKPGRQVGQRKNRIPDMVNIAHRPPEADDRAVPGHWEGDLLIGKRNATAIATLIERATGYALLVPLPDDYKPDHVAPALARKVQTLPDALRRSLTWDQGPEMRDRKQVHVNAAIDVYFRDPHAPGSAAPTRTPTACCASTSPRAPTSAPSARPSSTPSPANSMTGPASASASPSRPSTSPSCCCNDRQNPPIRLRHRSPVADRAHARCHFTCAGRASSPAPDTRLRPQGGSNSGRGARSRPRREPGAASASNDCSTQRQFRRRPLYRPYGRITERRRCDFGSRPEPAAGVPGCELRASPNGTSDPARPWSPKPRLSQESSSSRTSSARYVSTARRSRVASTLPCSRAEAPTRAS